MNKYLMIIFAGLLVFMVACGNEGSSDIGDKSDVEDHLNEKENTESVEIEEIPDEDDFSFEGEIGYFDVLGTFLSEDAGEDESYNIDFDGFLLDINAALVDIELNEEALYDEKYEDKDSIRAIFLHMNAENTTDLDVDFNGATTVVTSDGEQLSADYGILSENEVVQTYYGKVKEEGYFIIPLKNDDSIPDNIEVLLDTPYIVEDGGVDPENGALGENQRFKLNFHSKDEIIENENK